MYTLCSKVPQFFPTLAMVVGVPEALTIAQVLLIDIGTDIWTAIAYAFQPAESKLMGRAPRHPKLVKLADWGVGVYSYCYIGVLQCFFCWVMFFQVPGLYDVWQEHGTGPYKHAADKHTVLSGKTIYYWTLVLGQIAAALSTTTERQSLFTYCFPNTMLNIAIVGEVCLGLVSIYCSFMHDPFDTTLLPPELVLKPIIALVSICLIEEVRKFIFRTLEEQGRCAWCLETAGPQDASASDDDFTESGSDSHEDSEFSEAGKRPLLC